MHRRLILFCCLLAGVALLPLAAQADTGQRCFANVPGITNCISGRIREYWEQNGGLPVFGYPISAQAAEQTRDGSFQVQYFERNRFELHPEKARPYDVLLGRLGDDRLQQQGRDWHSFGPAQRIDGCLYFVETRHNVCDLQQGAGFRSYWEGHGLQDPALNSYQRSLALFGLPLSDVTTETNAAGDTVLTQWFERARFELHLDKPAEFRVLLGLLGNETRTNPTVVQPTVPTPLPAPSRPCDGLPGPQSGIAMPDCVHVGETLVVTALNFGSNQSLRYTVAHLNGAAVTSNQSVTANGNGIAGITINTGSVGGSALSPGDYLVTVQAADGGSQETRVAFRVLP